MANAKLFIYLLCPKHISKLYGLCFLDCGLILGLLVVGDKEFGLVNSIRFNARIQNKLL